MHWKALEGIPWQSSGLGLRAFTAVGPVQSLVGELKSYKPYGMAQENGKKALEMEQTILKRRSAPSKIGI